MPVIFLEGRGKATLRLPRGSAKPDYPSSLIQAARLRGEIARRCPEWLADVAVYSA